MTSKSGLMYLNIAHFFDHFFLLIFPTAVIAIEGDWALTYGEALALGTSMYVAFGLATLPAGWLGDHFPRPRLITIFFLGCGAASIFVGFSTSTLGFTIGLGLLGAFTAMYHPVGLALVVELANRPGRALAVNGVFGNMGLAGAALVTGLLTERFGWRTAFIVPGLVSVGVGCLYALQQRSAKAETRASERNGGEQFDAAARSRQIRVFIIVLVSALFGGVIFNAVTVSLPKLFDERLMASGVNLAEIGSYTALVFAVAAFAQLPTGDLLDRFGARPILIGLLIPQAAALVIVANTFGVAVIPIVMVLVILMFAEVPVTSWLLGHYVAPNWRSRALSAEYTLSLGVGAAVIPLMAWGHRMGHGFNTQFLILAASAGIVLVAAFFLPGKSIMLAGKHGSTNES